MEKTHWLQNPNKNYLGHQDLPSGNDIVVTIKSANWEKVKNPVQRTEEMKRVIRFEEEGVKPFICNETNASSIIKATGAKFMEDSIGKKITLYVSQTKVMRDMVDCIRIREEEIQDTFDNLEAIKKLNECKTFEDVKKTYLSLSHKEKADKKVVDLTNNLKEKLGNK